MKTDKKYAYVTLLSSNEYVYGVIILIESLLKVNSKYPLIVMITEDISEETINILKKLEVIIVQVEKIKTPDVIYQHNLKLNEKFANTWRNVLTKYQVWNFTEYDKIILLDCDLLILKNIDHCFEMHEFTAAVDGEYFNLWPNWMHFNTGFLVLKPNKNVFENLVTFANSLNPDTIVNYNGNQYIIADQELLNLYVKDWPQRKELHLNKYYNVFAPHIFNSCIDDIINNAYFVHFTGEKPWRLTQISSSNISVLTIKEALLSNIISIELYAYAYTYLYIKYKENYKKIDWNAAFNTGIFYYYVAKNLCGVLAETDLAKKYCLLAKNIAQKDNNIELIASCDMLFKEVTEKAISVKKSIALYDFLKQVVDLDKNLTTNYSAEFYIALSSLELAIKHNLSYYAIDELWNEIIKAINKSSLKLKNI